LDTLAVPSPKPEFTTDVPLSVLEHKYTRLEYLDSKFNIRLAFWNHFECGKVLASSLGEIDVGLLARAYASV